MAIALEFIDVVVRRQIIQEKYPGGWEGCLSDHRDLIGGRVWFDEHLFRDGAMSPTDARAIVERWESRGFEAEGRDKTGNLVWKDVCVVEGAFGGPTLPCDWLIVRDGVAHLAGAESGGIQGPDR